MRFHPLSVSIAYLVLAVSLAYLVIAVSLGYFLLAVSLAYFLLAVSLAYLLLSGLLGATAAADDARLVLGKWRLVKWEDYGHSKSQDVLDETEIEFTAHKFRVLNAGNIPDSAYTLDSTKSPKWIVLREPIKNRESLGIYELSGDELKICLETRGLKQRPTAFESKHEPPNNMLFVLRRKTP